MCALYIGPTKAILTEVEADFNKKFMVMKAL
jgi:hypothetical protein